MKPERDPPVARAGGRATPATTYSASTSSSVRPSSHAGPSDVWTSSAIEHLPVARRLEPLEHRRARAGRSSGRGSRRTGRPGAYGRTPANRDGSSARPWRARSRSPQRSVGASSVVGIVRGQTRNVSTSSRSSIAARRANGSPTDSSTGPEGVNTPRRSRRDVEPAHDALLRPQRPGVAQHGRLRARPSRGRARGPRRRGSPRRRRAATRAAARRRFQTSIASGRSSPNATWRAPSTRRSGRRRGRSGPRRRGRARAAARPCPAGSRSGRRARSRAGSGRPPRGRRAATAQRPGERRHGRRGEDLRRAAPSGRRAVEAPVEVDDQPVGQHGRARPP